MTTKKQTARLEQWSLLSGSDGYYLSGFVYGHPKLPDEEYIYTTKIVKVDTKNRVAETRNTYYTLGEAAEREPNYN